MQKNFTLSVLNIIQPKKSLGINQDSKSDSGEIRTHDRSLRRRMLYPAELPNQQHQLL